MKKFVIVGLIIFSVMAWPVWAADNTLTKSDNLLTFTSNGGTNDNSLADNGAIDAITGYKVNYPNGAKVNWIIQISTAAGQRALVRNRTTAGDYLFSPPADVTGAGVIIPYYGKTFHPVFKNGEIPSGVVIQMLLDE
jgi:hypothetical protein